MTKMKRGSGIDRIPDMIDRSAVPGLGRYAIAYIPHVGWLRHEPDEEVISLLRQGYFEAFEQAFYWLYFRPGDVFIDCGAHIGLYSIIADRATGGATRVIAVEPGSKTADHLVYNLKHNGITDAQIIRSAIWKAAGQIQFIGEGVGKAAYAHVSFDKGDVGASVPTVTLDQIVKDAGAKEVALVKIDVEGAEPEALSGGEEAIDRGMFPVLMVEFTEHNLQRRGLSTQDLTIQLNKLHYTLCEFSRDLLELVPFSSEGPIWYKNLFACRDMKQVNARLRSASEENRVIALDILGRALACNRFKELQDLDRYRNMASEFESYRQSTDKLLAEERQLSVQMRNWAEKAEVQIAREQNSTKEMREWAERTEKLLSEERQTSGELRQWAERTEKLLAEERQTSGELRKWAERTEKMLSTEKENSLRLRSWAERTEEILALEHDRVTALEREIAHLKEFVQRVKWIYRIYLRFRQGAR